MLLSQDLATLKLVRVGRWLSQEETETVTERIREAFLGLLRELQVVDHAPLPVDRIEAGLLTRALDQELGGHILGVTDADLLDSSGREIFPFMFGGKDERNDVAVVSTRRLGSRDRGRSLARLMKVSLHELGHNFGLVHHYSFEPAAGGGGYCPMTKGDFNRHGEVSYVRTIIDGRGYRFCERCGNFLRRRWRRGGPCL